MKFRILTLLFTLFLVFSYSGCSSSSDSNDSPVITTSTGITGTVSDMEGNALANVTLYSEGNTTTTDDNGLYTIKTSASKITLTAELSNYARNSKLVTVVNDSLTTQNIRLSKVDTIESFNGVDGATIKAKGATIDLPSAAYTLDDGTTYTGKVTAKATYNRVTTIDGNEAFPGDFTGETSSGDTKVLQSYGFIDITLESDSGNNVNLATGATATLTYPMDPTITETPATIPLWYFDTQKGIWVEDSVATYDATTNTYVGQVSHFSTWNLDAAFDGAKLKGCVEDSNGERIKTAQIFLSTAGWNNYGGHTVLNDDESGEFELINAPSNTPMSIIAKVDDLMSVEQNITLPANTTTVMSSCLIVDTNASDLFTTIKGQVVNNNNDPISGQNINISSFKDGVENWLGSVRTDTKGNFVFSQKRASYEEIKLSTTYQSIVFNKSTLITTTNLATIDVGQMLLATTTYSGCVTLKDGSRTSDENITTLPSGVVLEDGTTISTDGFTHFGTNSREIASTTPYNTSSYSPVSFDENGLFSVTIQTDNLNHTLYAHTFIPKEVKKDTQYGIQTYNTKDYVLTGKLDFLANLSSLSKTNANECIKLDQITSVSKNATASISSSNSDVHVEVTFVQDNNEWGEIVAGSDSNSKSLSFDINNNGIYIVKQVVNDYNLNITFNDTMSLVLDGKTHTITLPDSSGGQGSEWWTAYKIEAYNGSFTVTEINKAW